MDVQTCCTVLLVLRATSTTRGVDPDRAAAWFLAYVDLLHQRSRPAPPPLGAAVPRYLARGSPPVPDSPLCQELGRRCYKGSRHEWAFFCRKPFVNDFRERVVLASLARVVQYITLPTPRQLFVVAADVIKGCPYPKVALISTVATRIGAACRACGEGHRPPPRSPPPVAWGNPPPRLPWEWSDGAGAPPGTLRCGACRGRLYGCAVCHRDVRGLFVWNPLCGHGGHLRTGRRGGARSTGQGRVCSFLPPGGGGLRSAHCGLFTAPACPPGVSLEIARPPFADIVCF